MDCTPRRKSALQKEGCTNTNVRCRLMPLVCSLEAFERILLIWLDATELFMGEKLPSFFLLWLWQISEPSTSKWSDITQHRALLNIILTAYLQARADTYCVLARCLFSGFLAYMISCHEYKSKCFGTRVTPFKSTDSSVHFMFITFIHFSSGGSD